MREMIKDRIKSLVRKGTIVSVPNERTFLYGYLSNFSKTLINKTILDIGAGQQQYKHLFTDHNSYEACDLELGFHPGEKPDLVASIYDIPREKEQYDVVLLLQVLEHLEYPLAGLREVHRLLKEGGLLFISVPQASGDHFAPHHYFNYTQFGLQSVLRQTSFEILEHYRLAGMFAYVGNRIVKLGETIRHQYKKNGNITQRVASIGFCIGCYSAGYVVSLFNRLDKHKDYCIGHVVIAQKVANEEMRDVY
jgi:SAM-dependent methyltransferase